MLRGQATCDFLLQPTIDLGEEKSLTTTTKSTTGKVYTEKKLFLALGHLG